MLYAKVISARLAAPLRSACIKVFERRACPMPFAWVSGMTKSCDKNQNSSVIQLKPKPTIVSPSPAPPSTAFPKFCLAQDPAGLWVAENGDTIVGFGFSWITEKFWCLSQLFVRPETQAKGVGQALLSKTLMQAERNGAANRALVTFAYNIASTGLYLNNGLYPREPLYRMVAPAQTVAQKLGRAGCDITPIAPWPQSGE